MTKVKEREAIVFIERLPYAMPSEIKFQRQGWKRTFQNWDSNFF